MLFENNFYRTSDGLLDIEFLFVDLGADIGWRAYILSDIDYKMFSLTRSDGCSTVHRLIESNGDMKTKVMNFMRRTRGQVNGDFVLRYICWTGVIRNLDDIRELAKTWSEITAYYIRNGGTFGTIQPVLKSYGIISL